MSETKILAVLIVAVCAAVVAVHWPALYASALSFDDNQYLVDNALVQSPSWASAWRFLSQVLEPSTVGGYYQPLAMISLMLDYSLGGRPDNLMPFHRTSLVMHAANTALIIVLLYLLFGQPWIAAAVGLLFGLHPMTVEPITWVGERKTLLAAFFALWSLLFYIRYAKRKTIDETSSTTAAVKRMPNLCLSIFFYLLALMSKPTSTPLPLLMLLLDFWPLKRLRWQTLLEKIPFFVLGIIFAVITYISQTRTASTTLPTKIGIWRVLLILCHNIIFYLYKIVCPINLSSHYPFPAPIGLSNPMVLAGVIGTCILIALLLISLRWTRAALAGWLFFFLAILPTMQIISFTTVVASDKFAYLPSFGLLMILATFLCQLKIQDPKSKIILAALLLAAASAESIAVRNYLVYWRSSVSLYEHMLSLAPNSPFLHNGFGRVLRSEGRLDEAINEYRLAIELDNNFPDPYYNMANALRVQGKIDEAILRYRQALLLSPDFVEAHTNLAVLLAQEGKLDEAIQCERQALRIKPNDATAHNNLATDLASQGKLDEAVSHFRIALQLNPNYTRAHFNLGIALCQQGKFDEAITHFRFVLRQKPDSAEVYYNIGLALRAQDKLAEALSSFREAMRLAPDVPMPLTQMAQILASDASPNIRDVKRAVKLAERAAELTNHQDAEVLDTLAAAYAADSQFDKAVSTAQKALDIASAQKNVQLTDFIRKQLAAYQQAKP